MGEVIWSCFGYLNNTNMLKYLVTLLATSLAFSSSNPSHNLHVVFKVGVNGTFYCTKTGKLANLVWWGGKEISPLPVRRRGGLVCWKDGRVEGGYFEWCSSGVKFNGRKISPQDVCWALAGGGLFLLDNKVYTSKDVAKREGLSTHITNHKSYSFILVHKDRRKITLGVSKDGIPPAALAQKCKGKYYALLRLDGGSATHYFFNSRKPTWVNNAVGLPQ